MAGFSAYCETKVLEHITSKTEFAKPSKVYLALCTTVPTKSSTGTTIVEASYTGYARKEVKNTEWESAVSGSPSKILNEAEIKFAACTGGSSTIIGWALCDASTVGNVLAWGTAASTVISTTQTPATVAAKVAEITLE